MITWLSALSFQPDREMPWGELSSTLELMADG